MPVGPYAVVRADGGHMSATSAERGVSRRGASRTSTMTDRLSAMVHRIPGWESPVFTYYLIAVSATMLVGVGLVMVLSSSAVPRISAGQAPYSDFFSQVQFAVIGLVLLIVASRVPMRMWRKLSWVAIGGSAVFILLLVTPLAHDVKGNTGWVKLGPFIAQPAEATKLALALWLPAILAQKAHLLNRWQHVVVPIVPVVTFLLFFVLLGRDLGTALVLMILVGGTMFLGGVPKRFLASAAAVGAVVVFVIVVSSPNRMDRIASWAGHEECDRFSSCWQTTQGVWALGSGGWWGTGLGASKAKTFLPEAHNDFIFAVLGEELGMSGSFLVLSLFAALALGCYRIMVRHTDRFAAISAGAIMIWIVGQAFLNIAVVLTFAPVFGVPLPLVSSGGSALITAMTAVGILLSFARSEPGAPEVFRARRGAIRQSFAVVRGGSAKLKR